MHYVRGRPLFYQCLPRIAVSVEKSIIFISLYSLFTALGMYYNHYIVRDGKFRVDLVFGKIFQCILYFQVIPALGVLVQLNIFYFFDFV